MNHTKEPWRVGNHHNCVISDTPIPGVDSEACVEYYGGHCICESCTDANSERIIACVNACKGITNEALDAGLINHLIGLYALELGIDKQDLKFMGISVYEKPEATK
jgi:hypothetical protein